MSLDRRRIPAELHARYGIKPRNKFWLVLPIVSTLLIIAFFTVLGNRLIGQGTLSLIEWQEISPTEVEIIWNINRPDNAEVWCVARVQDAERFDVGFATFRLAATAGTTTYRIKLNTLGENFAVPSPTCSPNGWEDLAPAHFRPGLLPPAQTSPLAASWQPVSLALDE